MRFFEFTLSEQNIQPRDNSEGVLITLLQFLKNKGDQHSGAIRVPMQSVIAMMQNAGLSFDYTNLEQLAKKSDTVKNLIKSFNKDEIIVKTLADEPQAGDMGDTGPGDEKTVSRMAKKAASRRD